MHSAASTFSARPQKDLQAFATSAGSTAAQNFLLPATRLLILLDATVWHSTDLALQLPPGEVLKRIEVGGVGGLGLMGPKTWQISRPSFDGLLRFVTGAEFCCQMKGPLQVTWSICSLTVVSMACRYSLVFTFWLLSKKKRVHDITMVGDDAEHHDGRELLGPEDMEHVFLASTDPPVILSVSGPSLSEKKVVLPQLDFRAVRNVQWQLWCPSSVSQLDNRMSSLGQI